MNAPVEGRPNPPDPNLAPMPRSPSRSIRRWATIALYELQHRFIRGDALLSLLTTLLVIGLLALPAYKANPKMGIAGIVAWVIFKFYRLWRDASPRGAELVKAGYRQRKLMLYRLVHLRDQADALESNNVRQFQELALTLISNHVRHTRGDRRGAEIFANLLVANGNEMVVIARDALHTDRTTPATMSKSCSLAWQCLNTGREMVTGDVYEDFPETMPGKPYRSVLVLPIKFRDALVGVVSIDSSKRYHFDGTYRELVVSLLPFVALLGWTLADRANIFAAPPLKVPGGDS